MAANSGSFQPGNLAALKHGARSARLVKVKQQKTGQRVRRELSGKDRKWLERLIVDCEIRLERYREYLNSVGGPISARGRLRGCLERQGRDENELIRLHALWDGRDDPESDNPLAVALRDHWRRQALGRTDG